VDLTGLNEPMAAGNGDLAQLCSVRSMLQQAWFVDVSVLPGGRFNDLNQSGACFDNVNMPAATIRNAELRALFISVGDPAPIPIDGKLVSDLPAAYRKNI